MLVADIALSESSSPSSSLSALRGAWIALLQRELALAGLLPPSPPPPPAAVGAASDGLGDDDDERAAADERAALWRARYVDVCVCAPRARR